MIKPDATKPVEDGFDAFLRQQLVQAKPYLPDDNFTAQLLHKLPAQKTLFLWQERLIVWVPLIIISVLVLSQFSLLAIVIKLWALCLTASIANILQIGILTTVFVMSGALFWFAKQLKII